MTKIQPPKKKEKKRKKNPFITTSTVVYTVHSKDNIFRVNTLFTNGTLLHSANWTMTAKWMNSRPTPGFIIRVCDASGRGITIAPYGEDYLFWYLLRTVALAVS